MIDALLEKVYAKCVPDEHGCMNWRGAVQSACKSPTMRKNAAHGVSLRRWMLEEASGRALPASRVATYLCGNDRCVRLEHLGDISRKALQQRNDSLFDAAARIQKSRRIAIKARERSKLSPELAREIRNAEESQRAIAKRYGISQATVGSIRRGLTWRDTSNPFLRLAA